MPPDVSESYPLPFALDLGLTLGPLQRGSTDPTISFDGDEVWRAARTPAGPATLHLHLAGARVVADGCEPNRSVDGKSFARTTSNPAASSSRVTTRATAALRPASP